MGVRVGPAHRATEVRIGGGVVRITLIILLNVALWGATLVLWAGVKVEGLYASGRRAAHNELQNLRTEQQVIAALGQPRAIITKPEEFWGGYTHSTRPITGKVFLYSGKWRWAIVHIYISPDGTVEAVFFSDT